MTICLTNRHFELFNTLTLKQVFNKKKKKENIFQKARVLFLRKKVAKHMKPLSPLDLFKMRKNFGTVKTAHVTSVDFLSQI